MKKNPKKIKCLWHAGKNKLYSFLNCNCNKIKINGNIKSNNKKIS